MATEGWARGRKKAGGQEKGTWSKILCAFCPHPDATSPPLPTTGALAFCPFLPPSAQLLKPCKGAALLPPLLWGAGWEGGLGGPDAGATGALLMAGPTVACRFPSSGDWWRGDEEQNHEIEVNPAQAPCHRIGRWGRGSSPNPRNPQPDPLHPRKPTHL